MKSVVKDHRIYWEKYMKLKDKTFSNGKDHRIYWGKAYEIERQGIFQTLDETKNHSHRLTVAFRTCLNILEQHFNSLHLILALNVILRLTQLW